MNPTTMPFNASNPTGIWVSLLGVLLLLTYYVATCIYSAYFHPLAKFPGPRLASISRLPFATATIKGQTYKWIEQLHRTYGPVVRIAPGELTTISSGAWKDIYLNRPELPKDPHSQTPPLNGVDSLFTADGHTHARMRRTFANAFSERALRDQAKTVESCVERLMQRLRRDVAQTTTNPVVTEIGKYYGYVALDIISDLTYGESFNSLEGDNENDMITKFYLGTKFGAVRNSLSYFYPLDRLFGYVFLQLTAKVRARNWKVSAERVAKRLNMAAGGIQRSDFLTPVVGNVNESREKGITTNELCNNCLAMVMAGSYLPTLALTTATYLLVQNPESYQRLKKEINTTFSSQEQISIASTAAMPYLSAVIDETLRLHHPTPIHLPRIIPPEGLSVDGQWIPGNTIIGVALQNAQTSPMNWKDPLSFCPERFLNAGHPWYDPCFENDNREAYHPFSIGKRNCIGAKLFLAEAKLVLARVLFSFDMQLSEKTEIDWMDKKAYLAFETKPVYVFMKERDIEES